jgi:hypothetical protein
MKRFRSFSLALTPLVKFFTRCRLTLHLSSAQYAFVPQLVIVRELDIFPMPADPPTNGPRVSMGFLAIGSEMVSFTLLGLLLDYLLGTMPGFTIGLTLLGVVAAFFFLIRMSQAIARKKPEPPDGHQERNR